MAETLDERTDALPAAEESDEAAKRKPTKAERLEAKAARLREAEQRRAAEPPAPRGRGWLVATAVLGVVCAALVVLLVIGTLSWNHQRESLHRRQALDTARTQALAAATSFAVDFGSYDYRHLDSDFAEVARRMTPDFAKSYVASSNGLKPTFVQYKTQVTAHSEGFGVTSVSRTRAVVVVFLDQTVRTTQSSTPRIDRNRLEIHLVHVRGTWLVAKLLAK